MTNEFVRCLCDYIIKANKPPKDFASAIPDALILLGMKSSELTACRQRKEFQEVEINGVVYFDTKELLVWGYYYRQSSKHVQVYWRRLEMGDNLINCDRI
jgi:hypothetical protein